MEKVIPSHLIITNPLGSVALRQLIYKYFNRYVQLFCQQHNKYSYFVLVLKEGYSFEFSQWFVTTILIPIFVLPIERIIVRLFS